MNLTETDQFKQMIEQHNEMFEMVRDLKEAVVGKDEYGQDGIIKELKEFKKAFAEHDKLDQKKFAELLEYQKKQQYFTGWTGYILRALGAIALLLAGHFIPKIF